MNMIELFLAFWTSFSSCASFNAKQRALNYKKDRESILYNEEKTLSSILLSNEIRSSERLAWPGIQLTLF